MNSFLLLKQINHKKRIEEPKKNDLKGILNKNEKQYNEIEMEDLILQNQFLSIKIHYPNNIIIKTNAS